MALTREEISRGAKVVIPAFSATVTNTYVSLGCVEVQDTEGKRHYIYLNQLNKAVPYINGEVYSSKNGDLYKYTAAADGLSQGTFVTLDSLDEADDDDNDDEYRVAYEFPGRPLRKFALSPEIAE